MKNILLTLEYDGTNFAGWQVQPNHRTVQGELEKVLSSVCATKVQLNGTSRTDSGVHAYGQRANFKAELGIPTEKIMLAANHLLTGNQSSKEPSGDVRITAIEEKPMKFHARYDAVSKTYIYKIRNCADTDVFDRNYSYQITRPLNVEAMRKGAQKIVGTHDFKCFQSAGGKELETTVRTISNLEVYEDLLDEDGERQEGKPVDKIITIVITGDGFLYNMVRIITGTLVDIGRGKIAAGKIPKIIEGKDRQKAGHTAPPQGLYLAEVYYK